MPKNIKKIGSRKAILTFPFYLFLKLAEFIFSQHIMGVNY